MVSEEFILDRLLRVDGGFHNPQDINKARVIFVQHLSEARRIDWSGTSLQWGAHRLRSVLKRFVFLRSGSKRIGYPGSLTQTLLSRRSTCLGLALLYMSMAHELHFETGIVVSEYHATPLIRDRASVVLITPGTSAAPLLTLCAMPLPHSSLMPSIFGIPECVGVYMASTAVRVLWANGDYLGAERMLTCALEACPMYIAGHVNRAVMYLARNDVSSARRCLLGALHLRPGPLYKKRIMKLFERCPRRGRVFNRSRRSVEGHDERP
jgi:hypothetical protein